jgi:hypothetical protein
MLLGHIGPGAQQKLSSLDGGFLEPSLPNQRFVSCDDLVQGLVILDIGSGEKRRTFLDLSNQRIRNWLGAVEFPQKLVEAMRIVPVMCEILYAILSALPTSLDCFGRSHSPWRSQILI